MEVDSGKEKSNELPEVDMYLHLLTLIYLLDQNQLEKVKIKIKNHDSNNNNRNYLNVIEWIAWMSGLLILLIIGYFTC